MTDDRDDSGGRRRPGLLGIGWLNAAFLGIGVAALGFDYVTLLRTPPPFVDEAWNADRAWSLIVTGRAFGSLDGGVFDRFDGYWTYFPWLGTLIQSIALRVDGPTLFAIRVTSFVFGLALLAAIFVIGRHYGGNRLGIIATVLVATSNSFMLSTHFGRHDVIAAAIGFSAIGLYVTDKSTTWSIKSIVSGLIIGLTLDIHANGLVFAPAIGLLYLLDNGISTFWLKRFWGFVGGGVLAFAYYIIIHVLPYPETYVTLGKPFGSWRAPTILSLDPEVWREAVVGLLTQVAVLSDLRLPLLIIALVFLIWRGSAFERKLGFILVALLLSFVLLVRYAMIYYEILVLPAADLLLAAFLIRVFGTSGRKAPAAFAGLLLTGALLVGTTGRTIAAFDVDHRADYLGAQYRVASAIAPTKSVIGSQVYWFGLTDHRYLSWEQLVYYQRFVPGSTLDDAFSALRPDYLILDRQVDQYVVDDRSTLSPFGQFLYISRGELDLFLERHGSLVDSFTTSSDGTVRVYRITWN